MIDLSKLNESLKSKFTQVSDNLDSYESQIASSLNSIKDKEETLASELEKLRGIRAQADEDRAKSEQMLKVALAKEENAYAQEAAAIAHEQEAAKKLASANQEAKQIQAQQESIAEREKICRAKEEDLERDARKVESLHRHVQRLIEDRQLQKELGQ